MRTEHATVPVLSWTEARAKFVRSYRQGEHLSALGPTGSGKSLIMLALLDAISRERESLHVAVLATKPRDSTLSAMIRAGWTKISTPPRGGSMWPPPRGVRRVLIWPPITATNRLVQRAVFGLVLSRAFASGRWTVYCDEVRYLTATLRLRELVEVCYLQGRSNRLGLWASTQRPAHVPLEFYTEATWMLLGRVNSRTMLRRIVDHCGAANADVLMRTLPHLPKYAWLVCNREDGSLWVTTVDADTVAVFSTKT